MSLLDWAPASLLFTIATYALFFEVVRRGMPIVRSQRKGQPIRATGVSRLYAAAIARPVTSLLFFICFYELPLFVFVIAASLLSQEAALFLLENWWFLAFMIAGAFIMALGMPGVFPGHWARIYEEDDSENEGEELAQ